MKAVLRKMVAWLRVTHISLAAVIQVPGSVDTRQCVADRHVLRDQALQLANPERWRCHYTSCLVGARWRAMRRYVERPVARQRALAVMQERMDRAIA
ncbi:hypothetical protein IXO141_17645 [Xanthomonas oryzae pv. oryzae]|nr:hypothetical protein IXO141_17645 [Xanthomonas oryzae pv. oryzae]